MDGVEQLLEVEVGRAQPATIGLSPGEPVGPLSIGRMGGWRIAANGVAAEHGWIYFDGAGLYLQSVDPQAPMFVDGQPVPTTWTPVHAPCTITLGGAKLSFIAAAEEIERTADKFPAPAAQSIAEPPRPPTPASGQAERPSTLASAARPFAPGELARRPDPEDSTRMGAIDVVAARARASALARPAASGDATPSAADRKAAIGRTLPSATGPEPSSPFPASPFPASMASPVAVAPPAAAPTTPPAGPGPTLEKPTTIQEIRPPSGIMAKWREASFAQKATLFLLPLALASVYVIFTEPPPAAEDTAADGSAPEASASASTSTTPSSTPTIDASPTITASPRPTTTTIAATPITASPATAAPAVPPPTAAPGTIDAAPDPPAAGPPASTAPAAAAPSPVAVVARPGSATQRTLERRAADSVAAGDWEGAAQLYEELAKQSPDRPAFAEAARILRARLK